MTRILAIDGAAAAGKMKRRALEARRFASVGAGDEHSSSAIVKRRPVPAGVPEEGESDASTSPPPAPDYRDLALAGQDHPGLVAGRESGLAPGSFPRSRP